MVNVGGRIVEIAADQTSNAGPELLPVRLAHACAQVLPIDGAGMSMFNSASLRVPIGASDEMAATAERLQFTIGEGPCLTAHAERTVVVAGESELMQHWPPFYREMVEKTPFRTIIAIPLQRSLRGIGALDLYLDDPDGRLGAAWDDAMAVADAVTTILLDQPEQADASVGGGPVWLDSPAARSRAMVWTAIGMVNVALGLNTVDALDVLRAYSFSHDDDIDHTAEELVTRRLSVDDLRVSR